MEKIKSNLHDQIFKIINQSICDNKKTYASYLKRLHEGHFTRSENQKSHFCVYFFPYNPKNKKVFIVHHKKSGLWISPGGHIDENEGLLETLNREIFEELGVKDFYKKVPSPFLLTITPIDNKIQKCKKHFDIWYLMQTNGNQFNVDLKEFHDTKWVTIDKAEKIVTNIANQKALKVIKTMSKINL